MEKILKIADDLLLIAGMALICFGVFFIYIPAGFITSGACLVILGILVTRRRLNAPR